MCPINVCNCNTPPDVSPVKCVRGNLLLVLTQVNQICERTVGCYDFVSGVVIVVGVCKTKVVNCRLVMVGGGNATHALGFPKGKME